VGRVRRLLPAALLGLLATALLALGWNRWPHEEPAALSGSPAATAPMAAASPATAAAPTTTLAAITTTVPDPAIVLARVPADQARPGDWMDALVAVSAGEVWAAMASADGTPSLIGHLTDGAWTLYRLEPPEGRILDLTLAPGGTVWAATDVGAFSFDSGGWVRRFGGPAGGVAVGQDGRVWIGGRRESGASPTGRLWLASWDGASWERVDASPAEAPEAFGKTPIAVLAEGEVWIAHLPGYWVEDDLMRYDGAAMVTVEIPGVPDATPDNGIPAVRVFEIAPASGGGLWVVGYLAADPDQAVLARFDGGAWSLNEGPLDGVSGGALHYLNLAVGPDGVVWFAFDGGLRSFAGATWASYLEGESLYNVDVAPDGTVWYTDDQGVHALP
jgi:hypothetical protein